jgi:hypothetical protein
MYYQPPHLMKVLARQKEKEAARLQRTRPIMTKVFGMTLQGFVMPSLTIQCRSHPPRWPR